jgi:hypothetical protein
VSAIDDGDSRLIAAAMEQHEARFHRKGVPAIVQAIDYTNRLADVFLKGEQVVADKVPYNPDLSLMVGDQVIVEIQGGRSYFITTKSKAAGKAISSAAITMIESKVLAVDTFELDFLNIPATYKHLLLEIFTRSSGAVTGTEIDMYFNFDTNANYDYMYIVAASGAPIPNPTNVIGAGVMEVGTCSGANAPADSFDCTVIDILGYSTAFRKSCISQTQQKRGDSSGNLIMGIRSGYWRSTAVVNRITCRLGAGNFLAGTLATLLGIG